MGYITGCGVYSGGRLRKTKADTCIQYIDEDHDIAFVSLLREDQDAWESEQLSTYGHHIKVDYLLSSAVGLVYPYVKCALSILSIMKNKP